MSSPWNIPEIKASAPKRGPGTQANSTFTGSALSVSRSWGASPDECAVRFVDSATYPGVTSGAWVELGVYGKNYWGVALTGPDFLPDGRPVETLRSSGGNEIEFRFWDERVYLGWDEVYGVFNRPVVRVIGGRRVRYYKHLRPIFWKRNLWTYTLIPYNAAGILNELFASGYVQSPWTRRYHPDQVAIPFLKEVDCERGRKLGDVLQEVSEWQGLVFTVGTQPFELVWARRGEGALPAFPERSDQQRLEVTLSGHPTRIHVNGERNVYLVLDMPMTPDWNRNWEEFFEFSNIADVVLQSGTDPATGVRYSAMDEMEGQLLALARAYEITVAEFAALRTDKDFTDTRKYANRSRMEMPAALYFSELVYRAYRPPQDLNINNVIGFTSAGMDIVETLPAKVTHNPSDPLGSMAWDATLSADGAGYVIAQGFRLSPEMFAGMNPERFRLNEWVRSQDAWRQIDFKVDSSEETGQFIILDLPVIRSDDYITITENSVASVNPQAVITLPAIHAALAFQWDPYQLIWPQNVDNPGRDEAVQVPGFYAEYVVKNGVSTEVPFGDGLLSDAKAKQIALPLLARQYRYAQGGFEHKLQVGDVIPELTGVTSRIGVECSSRGHVCRVELTNERPARTYQRPVDTDRFNRLQAVIPRQAELRDQANGLRTQVAALRHSPDKKKELAALMGGLFGPIHKDDAVRIENGSGSLPAFTPLWGKAPAVTAPVNPEDQPGRDNTLVVMPAAATVDHNLFAGATIRKNENATLPVPVQRTGKMFVRALGPVSVGDELVQAAGQDYLVASAEGADGAPSANLVAEEAVPASTAESPLIYAVRARPSGGGSGGTTVDAVWS